ncbi:MAG: hypothetical protein ABW146_08420 [Candidatus Sedimenticola sp. 6PFRAG7]
MNEVFDSSPYTKVLADRVCDACGGIYQLADREIVAHLITEALFQAAMDARRGKEIDLEYIGKLKLADMNRGNPWPVFTLSSWLTPKQTAPEAKAS